MVPKKDRTNRMCIDYRKLNEITTDAYPLPRIGQTIDALQDAYFLQDAHCKTRIAYFSPLDLASGY